MIAQSHQVKERRKSIHNTYNFPGVSFLLKTPLSSFVYSTKESWNNTMHSSHKILLHFTNYLTLIQTKSTNTWLISCLCLACLSCAILVELNPYSLGFSSFQTYTILMGNPMGVLMHAVNLLIIQLIFNIPLTSVSTGSSSELTCMQLLIVNHQLLDRSLHVN